MYNIGDYIVYKRDVCKVKEIKEKYFKDTDYYVLTPVQDESLRINVPINNDNLIREVMTKEEVNSLIKEIPNIETIDLDERMLESVYKD